MYVTPIEVETFLGMAYTDFKVEGRNMTEAEWISFVDTYQIPIQAMIHRYCRVITFDPTASNSLVVEYKSGRQSTQDDFPYVRGNTGVYNTYDYVPGDIDYYLKHLYYTGTINGVTKAPLVVEEDTAGIQAIPSWTTKTPRGVAAAGDYALFTEDEFTMVRFTNGICKPGWNNIRFTYTTGYDPESDEFKAIKLQVLRCFKNFVMLKKKLGEPFTIRAQGVRDYQQMFEPFDESHILGDQEKAALEPYRRFPIPGAIFE